MTAYVWAISGYGLLDYECQKKKSNGSYLLTLQQLHVTRGPFVAAVVYADHAPLLFDHIESTENGGLKDVKHIPYRCIEYHLQARDVKACFGPETTSTRFLTIRP